MADGIEPRPCPLCAGALESGWLCERHAGKPWEHDGCAGAGVPCVCNPGAAVRWRKVYAEQPRPDEEPVR